MKKVAITLFLALLSSVVYTQNAAEKFSIQGKTAQKPEGDIVLYRIGEGGLEEAARTKAKADNSFKMEEKINEPGVYRLNFTKQDALFLVIDRGEKISVTPDPQQKDGYVVKGSSGTDALMGFKELEESMSGRYDTLVQAYTSAMASGDSAVQKVIEQKVSDIEREYKEEVKKYIESVKNPVAAVFLAQNVMDNHTDLPVLVGLAQKYASSSNGYVKRFKAKVDLLQKLAVGQTAPDFTQNDPDNKPVKLSSMKGKYILIDFWASWCGPCRQENPAIVKVYQEFKGNNFDILGVSLDNDRSKWLSAIQRDGLTWMHVSDLKGWNNAVAKQYVIHSIPSNLLLDPEGKIIAKNLRAEELRQKLKELLMK